MAEGSIDPSHIEAAQRFIEEEAGPRRHLTGAIGTITSALAVGMSLMFLYWAWASVTAQVLRLVFLGLALTLSFLIYPTHRSANRTRIPWHDWLLALASIAVVAYPLWDFEEFIYRAAMPTQLDQIFGALTMLLVLEATRRTTGWVLPVVAIGFLAYASFGAYLPPPWTHQGYQLDRLVGHMYITLEGIFGVPLDVAATFIILVYDLWRGVGVFQSRRVLCEFFLGGHRWQTRRRRAHGHARVVSYSAALPDPAWRPP